MRIEIETERLDRLFPANIVIDEGYRVRSFGPSVARQVPGMAAGDYLLDHFRWSDDRLASLDQLADSGAGIQLLERSGKAVLAGSVLRSESAFVLAMRNVPSNFAIGSSSLNISDFAPDDPTVIGMMLIGLQQAMIEESRNLAVDLVTERQRSIDLLERVKRLAGFLAHDFNNFLSIIKLNSDRILRESAEDQHISRPATIIQETAVRGSSLTQSLMTLASQRNDSRLPVLVDDLIRTNLPFLRTVVGSGVELDTRFGAAGLMVEASETGLINCLTNLLINARDAMVQGGVVTISTDLRSAVLDLPGQPRTGKRHDYLAIAVSDTGPGVDHDIVPRVFQPLFSTKAHGNGIGLASVLEFAREMGGDACLDSPEGSGACVYIYLPTIDRQDSRDISPAVNQSNRQVDRPGGSRQSILVVEDEPYALEALTELLELEGYAITPCSGASQALQAVTATAFDILLTDIVMPGDSGVSLAHQLCREQPDIQVILMSGFMPQTEQMQPDWKFIRKPMDDRVLLDLLRQASKVQDAADQVTRPGTVA